MPYGTVTGEDVITEFTGVLTISKNTHVHDDRCQAYDTIYSKSASSQLHSYFMNHVANRTEPKQVFNVSDRYAFREYLADALASAKHMIQAVNTDEVMDLASAGIDLLDNLYRLWRMRTLREDQWQTVLNFLQSALTHVEFENLNHNQCRAIERIIENYLSQGAISESEIEDAVEVLQQVDLDPWRGISKR
ncbi:MAG: hypothetical protein FVQ80_15825 [Planctomycetes bacterium]|nr:hypothetical protein [Planctomycetota bacterium]